MSEEFQPAVTFTPKEIEKFRVDRLTAHVEDMDVSLDYLQERFAPGTHGCHEALQMASVFMDSVDRHLCEHAAVLLDSDWYRLASEAQTALYNLYQAIAERHLTPVEASDEGSIERPDEGQKNPS